MKESNFKLKLDIQHFADARVDAGNYEEGVSIGDYILLNVNENMWIEDNVTAKIHRMTNKGQIEIPVIDGTMPQARPLCDEGVPGTQNTRKEDLKIDQMVMEEFDDCFTTAGIADKNFEEGLNTFKLSKLAEAYQNTALKELTSVATETTVDFASYTNNVSGALIEMQGEYFKKNGIEAKNLFVRSEMYTKMVQERLIIASPLGDSIFINGYKGQAFGLNVILNNYLPVEAMLTVADAINIGVPTDVASLDQDILGGYRNISGVDFANGVFTKWETKTRHLAVKTEVYMIFGMLVIPELAIKYTGTATVPDSITPVIDITTPTIDTWTTADNGVKTYGDILTEAGVTATDDIDGDVTSSITFDGGSSATDFVDLTTTGFKTITLTAQDSAGNVSNPGIVTLELLTRTGAKLKTVSKNEIATMLDEAGIQYPKGAKKPQLIQLAEIHNLIEE